MSNGQPATASPATPPPPSPATRKPNPLIDLIDSEKAYVDLLAGIIRKVAAAWSRANLPPPALDVMFRSIEAVYKANRALSVKLKGIGTNPSSPKALGDLLMRWIDDLDAPYTAYCTKYRCGFDVWPPVQANAKLHEILASFTAINPPPNSASSVWTLDDLFLLPKARLKYYRKLYGRLLKSTAPGRSDHKLLLSAIETLDRLLSTLEAQSSVNVADPPPFDAAPPPRPSVTEDEIVIDMRAQTLDQKPFEGNFISREPNLEGEGSSRPSTSSGNDRFSRETANTSISRSSTTTLGSPISDLERRLSTIRTLDIFTMQPKVVRLQMNPPSITFTREHRFSGDVVIRFTPQATGVPVVHPHAHIFLLSDLFLICEKILPEERSNPGLEEGADMWLLYPPLSGKVLRVVDAFEQANAFKIAIMRKEYLVIETKSSEARDTLLAQFKDCIDFAATLPPPSRQPPPPLPPIPLFARTGPGPASAPPIDLSPFPPPLDRHHSLSPPLRRSSSSMNEGLLPDIQPYHGPNLQGVSGGLPPPPRTGQLLPHPQGFAQHPRIGLPPPHTTPVGQYGGLPPNGPGFLGPKGLPNFLPGPHGPHPSFQQPPLFQPSPQRSEIIGIPSSSNYSGRPPSDSGRPLRNSISSRSLQGYPSHTQGPHAQGGQPPIPQLPGGLPPPPIGHFIPRSNSSGNLNVLSPQPRLLLPSLQPAQRAVSMAGELPSFDEPSPPGSPVAETPKFTQPTTSTISATMKCKVFLQQQHAQWKNLGSAKLKLYRQDPTNIKQLVVEAENKERSVLISTIVLTDGVERVGKTGVAIELSDKGARTGIIYMIQLRNEQSAGGLFDSLLEGSDRMARK